MSTPEKPVEYATPSLLRRLAAMVYDSLLLMAVTILYGFIAVGINLLIQGVPAEGTRMQWGYAAPLVFIGWITSMLGFFCYFWQRAGQTLGMKTWRMKIFSANGDSPSVKQCLVRCLCAPFSLLLLGFGYWWMYGDADRQTLHDRISGTRTYLMAKEKN
ncbi:RDD family protein [Cellvibrio japonicus]|uniref:Putative RDD family n=1 Tax=Cellvibrio japonicus (strain Ueda107) TaxID=498211 RepID=B3PDJ3_CELJU|nr:RDD family protein [Cellvibrio japonicus]ACE85875.1 putative RDD family [Cellvibrio japonicus Ueda107]QEI12010.1 RDD family protein [Cellvibrio japonicus]QEI15585.1 RDD family protein [Cellvibrio japonicus]QEI19163.1 RDD family protein [Cellvibrio japonicus]